MYQPELDKHGTATVPAIQGIFSTRPGEISPSNSISVDELMKSVLPVGITFYRTVV